MFTDSIFFESPADKDEESIKTGDALGALQDEIDPEKFITSFVSAGPKNYAYKLNDDTCKVTVKGITLSERSSKIITFNTIKDMVLGKGPDSMLVPNSSSISRNPVEGTLHCGPTSKTYRVMYTKRARNPDRISTMPYGYVENLK